MRRSSALGLALLGAMGLLRGQEAAPGQDTDQSPYHIALVNYKSGDYDKARAAIDEAEKATPGDVTVEILKSRILTEQKDYAAGEKLLVSLFAPGEPQNVDVQLALGDLLLRKRSFDHAAKYFALALQAKPNDPDIILKMVYAKVGGSDLISAGQYASHLAPLDAKNPYDDHASYYFAKAAIAEATGNSQGAEDDIQTARTVYGITITNRYLKLYLELFAAGPKPAPSGPAPAPSGAKQ